jgi:hypothetical protein
VGARKTHPDPSEVHHSIGSGWGFANRIGVGALRVSALKSLGNRVQFGIMATLRLDFRNSGQNVVQIRPGSAMSLTYQVDLMLNVKASGILGMAAINEENEGGHLARGRR